MTLIFWASVFLVFYTFIGYGILLYGLVKLKQLVKGKKPIILLQTDKLPTLTVVVAAYNEEDFIEKKIKNTLSLSYPKDKIEYLFVTDGSSDSTPSKVAKYIAINLLHTPERKGKIVAIHRAMTAVKTEVVVFTDANTFLNQDALLNIAKHYSVTNVGAVAGEKRVHITDASDATAGEGFYWKYESALKKWDSELYSVVGAAGELFSIRTALYKPVPATSIIDDFMISLLIAQKGYRIVYEPEAFAVETASANTKEELKRKIRIAAGGIQSIIWLRNLLNPFRHPILSFQYISHRVLRWTMTPFALITAFLSNLFLVVGGNTIFYQVTLLLQSLFYIAATLGWFHEKKETNFKAFFVPYYFSMMNFAVIAGIRRYFLKSQSAAWEKAKRK